MSHTFSVFPLETAYPVPADENDASLAVAGVAFQVGSVHSSAQGAQSPVVDISAVAKSHDDDE